MERKSIVKQAVILAGGKGERLMPYTANKNKGMVPVAGRPFLEHLVELFKKNGIKRILILTGHAAESITNYFGNGEKFGVEISYHYSPPEINHGKRLALALPLIDNFFLLHKCDIYWPLNLSNHLSHFQKLGLPAMMTVYRNSNKDGIYGPMSNIRVNKKSMVEKYDSLSPDPFYGGHDIGFCLFQKKVIEENLPPGNFSLHEGGILGTLAEKGLLGAFQTDISATTTTDIEWLKKAEYYFKHTLLEIKKQPRPEYL